MRFKQTNISRFENFFHEKCADKILDFSNNYPDGKSFIINYDDLEMFDPDLADFLIDNAEEVIYSAEEAIKNITCIDDKSRINIRFENNSFIIPLDSARSDYIGKLISIDGIIKEVEEPSIRLDTAVCECKACSKLYEVEQNTSDVVFPNMCSECGTPSSFKLLPHLSKYTDVQKLTIGMDIGSNKTSRELLVLLEDDLISQDGYKIGQHIRFTGYLKPMMINKDKRDVFLVCNNIERLSDVMVDCDETDVPEKEYGARDSPEYNEWRNEILTRDKVCQCCGSEKEPVAHHIFGYEDHPEYRVHSDNGIRLCKWCHGKYHSHYGIRHANPITFVEFIQRFGSIRK